MNENQMIVLNHLIENQVNATGILTMIKFSQNHFGDELPEEVAFAYSELTKEEDFEVLKAFAAWGLGEEE